MTIIFTSVNRYRIKSEFSFNSSMKSILFLNYLPVNTQIVIWVVIGYVAGELTEGNNASVFWNIPWVSMKFKMSYWFDIFSLILGIKSNLKIIVKLTCKSVYEYSDSICHWDEKQKSSHFHLPWSEQPDSYIIENNNYENCCWAIFEE